MFNPKKVRWMAKAAAFDQMEEKDALRVNHYFRWDYVVLGMLRTFIGVTIAAVLIGVVWGLIAMEDLLTAYSYEQLIELGKQILFYYIVALLCFVLVSFFVYQVKYTRRRKRVEEYLGYLKKIRRYQDKEYQDALALEEERGDIVSDEEEEAAAPAPGRRKE